MQIVRLSPSAFSQRASKTCQVPKSSPIPSWQLMRQCRHGQSPTLLQHKTHGHASDTISHRTFGTVAHWWFSCSQQSVQSTGSLFLTLHFRAPFFPLISYHTAGQSAYLPFRPLNLLALPIMDRKSFGNTQKSAPDKCSSNKHAAWLFPKRSGHHNISSELSGFMSIWKLCKFAILSLFAPHLYATVLSLCTPHVTN